VEPGGVLEAGGGKASGHCLIIGIGNTAAPAHSRRGRGVSWGRMHARTGQDVSLVMTDSTTWQTAALDSWGTGR
jgi:hypothetical protein